MNTDSGLIAGLAQNPGAFDFTAQVIDAALKTASKDFRIIVARPLGIVTDPALPQGIAGQKYAIELRAEGGTTPYAEWTILGGKLPDGLPLNPTTGSLSGTPNSSGAYDFTVQVRDSGGLSVVRTFSLLLAQALAIIQIGQLQLFVAGDNFREAFEASGGTAPYRWSLGGGNLPPGLRLDSTSGVVSGTLASSGNFQCTIQVADSGGQTSSVPFSLAAGPALAFRGAGTLPAASVGKAYESLLVAEGGVAPYAWRVTNGSPPSGLSLDAGGRLAGTPGVAGKFEFTVTVRDMGAREASGTVTLSVEDLARPVVRWSDAMASASPGSQIRVSIGIEAAFGRDVEGEVRLDAEDPAVQFATGGRTARYRIPAGEREFGFSLQTGTVSGVIRLDLDGLPREIVVERTPPVIRSAELMRSGDGFEVLVKGFSPTRELGRAGFQFAAAAGAEVPTAELSVNLDAEVWFASKESRAFGGAFAYRQTFHVAGDTNAIGQVSMALSNAMGMSETVKLKF
jgi:hypothetical protein